MTSFESYQSPFSWRYGSPEMRTIWGEENKRLLWRKLWVTMAEAQTDVEPGDCRTGSGSERPHARCGRAPCARNRKNQPS